MYKSRLVLPYFKLNRFCSCTSAILEPTNVIAAERPPVTPPTISVTITSPIMQIVEFGQTVRLTCSGYSIVNRVSRRTTVRIVNIPNI